MKHTKYFVLQAKGTATVVNAMVSKWLSENVLNAMLSCYPW